MVLFEDEKDNLPELKERLREMFCLDSADTLDFGIYRIMNHKRERIEKFIDDIDKEIKAVMSGESTSINCEKCMGIGLYCELRSPANKPWEITCYCHAPKGVFERCIKVGGVSYINLRGYTYEKKWTHENNIKRAFEA